MGDVCLVFIKSMIFVEFCLEVKGRLGSRLLYDQLKTLSAKEVWIMAFLLLQIFSGFGFVAVKDGVLLLPQP
jgi:hypothetical protein